MRFRWTEILVILSILPIACGHPSTEKIVVVEGNGETYPVEVRDSLNRVVTVAKRPERIISLAPGLTETTFAIGAGPRLVAVTTLDTFPPECKELPRIGGFAPETINVEAILALKPDLVLAGGRFQEPVVRVLERQGLPVVVIDPTTLEAVQESILQVGKLAGNLAEARDLNQNFSRRLQSVRQRWEGIPDAERPRVFYVLWDEPLMTVGPRTFVGQMIELAGGKNIFGDSRQDYPRISDEVVLGRNPEILLVPDHGGASIPARICKRPGWNRLQPVAAGQIGTLPEDLVNRPGPRLIEGLEAIEMAIQKGKPKKKDASREIPR